MRGRAVKGLPLIIASALASLGRSIAAVDLSGATREQFVSRGDQRSFVNMNGQLHPTELNALASKRRRAQQGKPGKRWRGGHA